MISRFSRVMSVCFASLLLVLALGMGAADASPQHYGPYWGGHKHFYGHRHPGYGPFLFDSYRYGYYYPPPAYVAPPPMVYAPPPVQYVPPAVTYVRPPVGVPQVTAAPPPSSCLVVREYLTDIEVGGKTVEGYGYACLQPDGSWQRGAPQPVPYQ